MPEYMSIVLFIVVFALLLLGFPVAFTLGGVSLIFGYFTFGMNFFQLLPLRIWGTMTNYVLIAVPLFVYMGLMLEKSGLAEELLETMAMLFGKLRGGLAISVIVVGAVLAASTGIVGATVVTMGLLSLPTMIKRGYSPELSTGTICAAGTLGQIIPPQYCPGSARQRTQYLHRRYVCRCGHPGPGSGRPLCRLDHHRGYIPPRIGSGHAR